VIPNRFPWIWSPAEEGQAPPAPPEPPFWTKDTPGALTWQTRGAQVLPRFQHLYPQDSDIGWQKKDPV